MVALTHKQGQAKLAGSCQTMTPNYSVMADARVQMKRVSAQQETGGVPGVMEQDVEASGRLTATWGQGIWKQAPQQTFKSLEHHPQTGSESQAQGS